MTFVELSSSESDFDICVYLGAVTDRFKGDKTPENPGLNFYLTPLHFKDPPEKPPAIETLQLCPRFPSEIQDVPTPAVLMDQSGFELDADSLESDGRLSATLEMTAYIMVGYSDAWLTDPQRALALGPQVLVRYYALEVAKFVTAEGQFGVKGIGIPQITNIAPFEDVMGELQNYLVWIVQWTHEVCLGKQKGLYDTPVADAINMTDVFMGVKAPPGAGVGTAHGDPSDPLSDDYGDVVLGEPLDVRTYQADLTLTADAWTANMTAEQPFLQFGSRISDEDSRRLADMKAGDRLFVKRLIYGDVFESV